MIVIVATFTIYLAAALILPRRFPALRGLEIFSRWIALFDCLLVGTLAALGLLGVIGGELSLQVYFGFCLYDSLLRLAVAKLRKWDYLLHHAFVMWMIALAPGARLLTEGMLWLYGDGLAWVVVLLKQYEIRNARLHAALSLTRTVWYWVRFVWAVSIVHRALALGIPFIILLGGIPLCALTLYWALVRSYRVVHYWRQGSIEGARSPSWVGVFERLEQQPGLLLHQQAGWTDTDAETWREYVHDVLAPVAHTLDRPDCLVFEAGCGPGAFLAVLHDAHPATTVHAMDASPALLARCRQRFPSPPHRFWEGTLPGDLPSDGSRSYDLVLSNSVMQYLGSLDLAEQAIRGMIRLARSGGCVVVADVCDAAFQQENDAAMIRLWGDQYGGALPRFLYFPEDWFRRFRSVDGVTRVDTRRVGVAGYWRRRSRFVCYIHT